MIDPALFSNVPFRNATAWTDFTGTLWLYLRALAEHVGRNQGVTIRVQPIGDGDGRSRWLQAVQETLVSASLALQIAPPNDLSSYDLSEPEQFASWTFLVSQQCSRMREAAGIS